MQKITIILLLSLELIFAKSVNFVETKYIYALDKSIKKSGVISYDKESIKINYSKPLKKTLLYSEDRLIIKKGEKEKSLNLSKKPKIKYFFLTLKALYLNDETYLKTLFAISKKDDFIDYLPNSEGKRYIKNIRVKKDDFINIEMSSGDKIDIKIIK